MLINKFHKIEGFFKFPNCAHLALTVNEFVHLRRQILKYECLTPFKCKREGKFQVFICPFESEGGIISLWYIISKMS